MKLEKVFLPHLFHGPVRINHLQSAQAAKDVCHRLHLLRAVWGISRGLGCLGGRILFGFRMEERRMRLQHDLDRSLNIFVIGLDAHNRALLQEMRNAHQYQFHGVLTYEDIYGETVSLNDVLQRASAIIDAFDGPVDAIIGFWDFPVSTVVPLLRQRYGLPTVPLDEVLQCEHKYWSRLVQQEVIDELPRFALVAPACDQASPPGLRFPMWIKPVKSFASMLALRADNAAEFAVALRKINAGIDRLAAPFEEIMQHVELPPEIAAAGGRVCIAEEAIRGQQVTLEGFRHRGEVVVYGIIDSLHYPGTSSFLRYQYPSTLPASVQQRLKDISTRVVQAVGLEGTTFNIEFFWCPDTDAIQLLEINTRHSQSHADLFVHVDGFSNHEILIDLALGRPPERPRGKGRFALAATCFIRRFENGVVRRHPSATEIAHIERSVPDTQIELRAHAGDRLSERTHGQDSYSHLLATVFIGAAHEAELTQKFDQVVATLPYEIDDLHGASPARNSVGARVFA